MLDMTALAQSAPGPIAVNAAILAGRRIAGFPGMLAAMGGTILPPLVIIGLVSLVYGQFADKEWVRAAMAGMACGVAAVISDVVLSLAGKIVRRKDALQLVLMAAAFVLTYCLKVNVIFVLLGAMAVGVIRALVSRKEGEA